VLCGMLFWVRWVGWRSERGRDEHMRDGAGKSNRSGDGDGEGDFGSGRCDGVSRGR
jgi:hypothetical protein